MKSVFRFGLLPLVGCALVRFAFAQAVSPAPAPASPDAPPAKEDAVLLNPFEVSGGSDQGYAARETIAGTRFKSELKDVPSQISVMTKEFLQDIASVTVDDAFRYSVNVENVAEFTSATNGGGDFNTGVLNTRIANRIRGLTSPGVTHDFFQTLLFQDAYNTERVSISSGPNAILFGNGNPGGIADTAFIRANLQRPRYEANFRIDNYNSVRTAIDLNYPVLKDRVGLRVAAVNSRQNLWREPAGRDDDRYFATITVKPLKPTTIRAYYEDAMVDQTPMRNVRFGDQVTPWINAGRPIFNNGLTGTTLVSATNNSIFVRNGSTSNILVLGDANTVPYSAWGSAAAAVITAPATRYSANTIGPGSTPNQAGVDSYIYSLPYDQSISPWDVDVNGNGTRNLMYAKIWGASFEQNLGHNLFFQADYNRERVKNPISDFLRGIQSAVRADANQFLPDRVTPNPNVGRYYVEGGPRVFSFRGEKEESRAMLSYEFDLSRNQNWTKWLGRHRVAGMYQRAESLEVQQESGPRVIPAGTPFATIVDNYGGPLYNTFGFRSYLSDPTKTGGNYSVSLPFDPVRNTSFVLPDGSTYFAGIKNPFGANGSANLVNNLVEGRVVAMQNFFLKDRLVTSLGWRRDSVRQASYVTPRKTTAPNAAFVSIFDVDPPTNWSVFTAGNTKTLGAVGHILPWVSIFYNQSSTWNPPTGLINPDTGTAIAGATGKGKDYGIMLRFLGDRLSLRLNKYENTSGPAANEGFRNAVVPVVQNIENTLLDRIEDGTAPNVAKPKYYDSRAGTFTMTNLMSDLVSKGYEAELTANPNRNWRLAVNGAFAEATQSNIGKAWVNYIQERAPVWTANSTLRGPGNDTTTIATRYLAIVQTLNQMAQADGQKVENGRDWRLNLVTRYGFSEGPIKGTFVGGGYRWRSKQAIAYKAALINNAFQFAGAPAQVLVPALDSPIYGKPTKETELFFGYSRRFLNNKVNWRVQLNMRNIFNDRDPIGQRANISAGFVTVYAVLEPRSLILTNSFTF